MENTNKKLSVSALVGFVISIIALLLSAIPIINNFAAILAVISTAISIAAIIQIRENSKSGRNLAVAGLIISVLAFVIVLGSQAFYSKTLEDTGKEISKSFEESTGNATEELLKNDVDVAIGQFTVSPSPYGSADTSLPVTITNKNTAAKSYTVQIEAITADGKRLDTDSIYVNSLGSGQSQDTPVFKFVTSDKVEPLKGATFKVISVSQY